MSRRSLRALVAVALCAAVALPALCLCGPPAPPTATAHGCCDEGPGLVAASTGCCQDVSPANVGGVVVLRTGPPLTAPAIALAAEPPLSLTREILPRRPRPLSSPPLVLRV
jgi:hypothetical protein